MIKRMGSHLFPGIFQDTSMFNPEKREKEHDGCLQIYKELTGGRYMRLVLCESGEQNFER